MIIIVLGNYERTIQKQYAIKIKAAIKLEQLSPDPRSSRLFPAHVRHRMGQ
jgi:hypothetical protein